MAQAFQCKTWVQRQETERDSLSRRGSALAKDFEALPHDWTRCGKNLDGDDSLPQGLKPSLILRDLRGAKRRSTTVQQAFASFAAACECAVGFSQFLCRLRKCSRLSRVFLHPVKSCPSRHPH